MSYAFELFRPLPGADPRQLPRKSQGADSSEPAPPSELNPGPIDPKKEEEKERLAAALIARHPTLKRFQPDYAKIASLYSVDAAEARRRYRQVELNESQYSLQIYLFDDAAGASFSCSGSPEESKKALQLLWDCLQLLESKGSFSTYDSQVGRVLDLGKDFNTVLKTACDIEPAEYRS
jgi:hypothetical protein